MTRKDVLLFEADFRARFLLLNKELRKLEKRLLIVVRQSIKGAKLSTVYWNRIKIEVTKLYAEMGALFISWSEKNIPWRYKKSLVLMGKRIANTQYIANMASKGLRKLATSRYSLTIMRGLYDDAVQSYLSGLNLGKKNLFTLFRNTQQMLYDEALININVTAGFEMGNLRQAKTMLTELFKTSEWLIVDKKQFIQAGKMRYKPHYYAELVARTKFHQAHSQAALAQGANYGTDLMQVSSHNTITKICMDFEGKIFSMSGKDKRFPPLTDSPPYHPNCLHLIFPTFESAMQVQGTLESFSAFSKGDISRPPLPPSFIPIGSR